MITEHASAKINLTLDILCLRPDGYHELETIMQTIGLEDILTFSPDGEGIFLTCNVPAVPVGESNLICRAALLLREYTGKKRGARICLQKNIPLEAGLAGGSTDGAAALRGLNKLWDLGLSRNELLRLAEELGADVPFCLSGGTALARGKGERLEPLPPLKGLGVVLVKPPTGISTAKAYNLYDQIGGGPRPDNRGMVTAIEKKDVRGIAGLLVNVFEKVSAHLNPAVLNIKADLLEAGVLGASMSGSGPTVFGLCSDKNGAARIAGGLKYEPGYTVLATGTV